MAKLTEPIFQALQQSAANGIKPPRNVILDGFDMTSVLTGQAESSRTEMFWDRRGNKAARVGNWKWVESDRGSGLFDLSTDISEAHDLSDDKPDVFFVLEPAVNIEINITSFLRIHLGAGYRFISGIEKYNFTNSDFSGPSGNFTLKFGMF